MQIDAKQLSNLFTDGGALSGAHIVDVTPYGDNHTDGTLDGVEVAFMTTAGAVALILFDATEGEAVTVRFVTDDADKAEGHTDA